MGITVNNSEVLTDDRFLTVKNLSIDSNGYIGAESAPTPTTSPLLGTNYGYVTGGILPPSTIFNTIERFSVISDGNTTDVGDLYTTVRGHTGHSSETAGFTGGGQIGFAPGIATYSSLIQKFPFASGTSSAFIGNLINGRYRQQGSSSTTHGYVPMGLPASVLGVPTGSGIPGFLSIEKFPFFSDAITTLVGTATAGTGRTAHAAQSSNTNGYFAGGHTEPLGLPTIVTKIEKYPFSFDVDSVGIADLTQARSFCQGHSSATHGYTSGGLTSPTVRFTTIDKFPFASDANATDVGDLLFDNGSHVGISSQNFGYAALGNAPTQSPPIVNTLQKFSFSTDANATDVGDCIAGRVQGGDHSD